MAEFLKEKFGSFVPRSNENTFTDIFIEILFKYNTRRHKSLYEFVHQLKSEIKILYITVI